MSWVAVAAGAGSLGAAILNKPKAPKQAEVPKLDIAQAQTDAINANLQNFGAAAQIAQQTNDFNQSEATRLLEKAIPGFGSIQKKLLDQVNSDLNSSGLSADQTAQIQRFAAEKGISRGTSGGFNNFSLVKDFGFNLVDWENAKRARSLSTLSTVFGMAPRVNPTSPMAMLVSPDAAFGAQSRNAEMAYNAAQGGYNAQAAADNYGRSMMTGAITSLAFAGAGAYNASRTPTTNTVAPASTIKPATTSGGYQLPAAFSPTFRYGGG